MIENKVNLNLKSKWGRTALMRASSKGYANIVKVLVNAGADLNIKDNRGRTALTYANQRGHKSIVQILKAAGAK